MIFLAHIRDRQLKFLVNINMTNVYLIYTLFCPSVLIGVRFLDLYVFVFFSIPVQKKWLEFSGIK